MFEVSPETVPLKAINLDELMQSLDVYISIRPKPKQNVYSVVIKGLEKNAGKFHHFHTSQVLISEEAEVVVQKVIEFFCWNCNWHEPKIDDPWLEIWNTK